MNYFKLPQNSMRIMQKNKYASNRDANYKSIFTLLRPFRNFHILLLIYDKWKVVPFPVPSGHINI